MNQLSQETSPYLLQHAQNPVHWKAWNSHNLAEAKSENKMIIVSIGYSACHWCHVMEHETFEDEEAAKVMNANFINIKVDREERPDVDAVYMKAVQIMTGRGGWPMNVVCLPDGRPVWGGTYFRKTEWMETLLQLQEMFQNQPEKMVDYAEKLHDGIISSSLIPKTEPSETLPDLQPLLDKWKKSFDHEFGGYTRAPKFMMPNNYSFLLQYAHLKKDPDLLDYVNLTLEKMAFGGLFDTVGGGFSRYAVDMKWHVPHFEKMLYDNAQLVSLYAEAFRLTKNPLYQELVEKTLSFVMRDLSNGEGGFFSALDADSLTAENHLEEGAFYVWTKTELQNILQNDFNLFAEIFNINDFGHWENGNYVLIQSDNLENIALKNNVSASELHQKKKRWEEKLFQHRSKRNPPRLDDKSLTSWNAMMLTGFVEAYKSFNSEEYLDQANKTADFIVEKLWHENGNLWHSFKDGKATINGYLEDYCFTIEAFIKLYETTFDENWLQLAKNLTDYCFDHFYDDEAKFFSFTSRLDDRLISPHFEIEDNVISASNSVMASNLYLLGIYFENPHYTETSKKMVFQIVPVIDYPSAFANWLKVSFWLSEQSFELAICGEDAVEKARSLQQNYCPNILFAGTSSSTKIPFLKDKLLANETLFYVCENQTCQLPTDSLLEVTEKLFQ